MSDAVLIIVTGLGLGALYFLAACGLSLVYGLMGVLNFAHGAFMVLGAYAGWLAAGALSAGTDPTVRVIVGLAAGFVTGAIVGTIVELVLIRPLYRHHIQQVLVTVGLSLAVVAAVQGVWGSDPHPLGRPAWLAGTTPLLGAAVPTDRLAFIVAALLVFGGITALLRYTRVGLVIRAGVENRTMVEALGIDVQRTFTLAFALGGAVAGLGGFLYGLYAGSVTPGLGGSLLIYAFIVVVIGGMGSFRGTAIAAIGVGLVQQLANYYAASGVGDLSVVLLLALVLLVRPRTLQGGHA